MKDKYLQIFEYLLKFSKIRSKPVRDIESSDEYLENVWLTDIPQCDIFDSIMFPDYNQDADYWLKICKPKEPKPPTFPALSEELTVWIIKDSLTIESGMPCLNESIIKNGKTIQLIEHPEIKTIFQEYLNNQWLDDFELYKKEVNDFKIKHDEFKVQSNIYKKFFSIYNKVQQFGEEFELVLGVGLLNFKENQNTPRICRHILTSKADITFNHSKNEAFIKVLSNIGSKIQVETDAIIDLDNQFNIANVVTAENKVKEFINREDISDNNFLEQIEDAIRIFIDTIHAEGAVDDQLKPKDIPKKPTVFWAPALLLRKRNTKSLAAVYEEIINNIKNADEALDIPSINGIIDSNYIDSSTSMGSSLLDHDKTIYFPKKYNDEQIQIIEKIRRNSKVLVQGPPGTGKSHTIANLICHLLANGQKVLVTAYTKRALEVLKNQLPQDFQNLTVNILSGDSTSMQDLNNSVNAINDKLASYTDINAHIRDIEKQKLKLSETKEAKAYSINEWSKVKEQSTTKQCINPNYNGTLLEIAERLESESSTFSWFKDEYSDIGNIDRIASIVEEFNMLVKHYQSIDTIAFDYLIPNIDKLLTLTELINYQNILTAIVNHKPIQENYISIITDDFKVLKQLLEKILAVSLRIERFCLLYKVNPSDDYLNNNIILWPAKILRTRCLLSGLSPEWLRQIERDVVITYPDDKSLIILKNDATTLLSYLKEGNSLNGFIFKLKK